MSSGGYIGGDSGPIDDRLFNGRLWLGEYLMRSDGSVYRVEALETPSEPQSVAPEPDYSLTHDHCYASEDDE